VPKKKTVKTLSYMAAWGFWSSILRPYFRPLVLGSHRIPRTGGLLVAANHFSFVDPLLLGILLPRRIRFVMSADIFRVPVVHAFSRAMDVIPVEKGSKAMITTVKRSLSHLEKGSAVGIFPEGQRSRSGTLLPPRRGLGVLAARSEAPVVPVAIVGTREAFPPGAFMPRPHRVAVSVGEPLRYDGSVNEKEIPGMAMDAIADMIHRMGRADYLMDSVYDPSAGRTVP